MSAEPQKDGSNEAQAGLTNVDGTELKVSSAEDIRVELPPIHGQEDLTRLLASVQEMFKGDWVEQVRALRTLVALCSPLARQKFHSSPAPSSRRSSSHSHSSKTYSTQPASCVPKAAFHALLESHSIYDSLVTTASTMRSALLKDACNASEFICAYVGNMFSGPASRIIPELLKHANRGKKVMSDSASQCMRAIASTCIGDELVKSIFVENRKKDSDKARFFKAEAWNILLSRCPLPRRNSPMFLHTTTINSEALSDALESPKGLGELDSDPEVLAVLRNYPDQLEATIRALLTDSKPNVRSMAINCFRSWAIRFPERRDPFVESLDSSTQERVGQAHGMKKIVQDKLNDLYLDLFHRLDPQGTKRVSLEELYAVLGVTEEMALGTTYLDKDGMLQYEEYLEVIKALQVGESTQTLISKYLSIRMSRSQSVAKVLVKRQSSSSSANPTNAPGNRASMRKSFLFGIRSLSKISTEEARASIENALVDDDSNAHHQQQQQAQPSTVDEAPECPPPVVEVIPPADSENVPPKNEPEANSNVKIEQKTEPASRKRRGLLSCCS